MASETDNPPRRRRKASRPAEILEAGLQEFAENGFAATRLEDIAARAGVVKGTLYLYFDSKETLFKEVVRGQVLPTLDNVHGMIDAFPGPTEELLQFLIRAIYDRVVKSELRAILRIILAEGVRFPEIISFYHAEVVSKGEDILRRIVERGVARGEFRASPVDGAYLVLVAPAIAAAIWKMTFESERPLDLDRYIAAHIDVILNGLRPRG